MPGWERYQPWSYWRRGEADGKVASLARKVSFKPRIYSTVAYWSKQWWTLVKDSQQDNSSVLQAKRFLLVSGSCGSNQIQHIGLLRNNQKAHGFGYNTQESYAQQLCQRRGVYCWYAVDLGKLLQVQWLESWYQ